MIDLHCHLLPGIDDGFKSLETALDACRMAAEDGIRVIVATPHMKEGAYLNEAEGIREAVAALQAAVTAEGIDIQLRVGSEVYWAPAIPEGIRSGRLATLGDGGRYLLLELPHRQQPVQIEETIFSLRLAGITPVLAHPERIQFFQEDIERLTRLLSLGALAQLTANSLTGAFKEDVRDLSEQMIRRRMIHFLASDAHDLRYRPPIMSRARERVAAIAGEEEARRLCEDNALSVLEGRSIESEDPLPPGGGGGTGRGMLGRWFGRLGRLGGR